MPTSSPTLSSRFSLTLPQSGTGTPQKLVCGQSVVVIGANGSGKTRLGSWIEFESGPVELVHRIAAQKSLIMPEFSATSSIEVAEASLLYNSPPKQARDNPSIYRNGNRWQHKPNTTLLNDFDKLMTLLFSEDYEKSTFYRQLMQGGNTPSSVPTTRLDVIKRIWQSVLPHRRLIIGGGKIEVQDLHALSPTYNGAEMSDGERVVFYLIGQALCAPHNGIIIVDEPELHLHKSIQTKLWLEIQAARSDCLFVYMTHDVEFAASLIEAKKIWLKGYNGQVWEWEEVPESELPEELLLEVLGSRQPILFVEGDNGSYDVALFRVLYPTFRVIPRAGCEQVVLATRALREARGQIHTEARGIIDRDRRHPQEIPKLNANGVEVLSVAEVENLFCVPDVLRLVAEQLGFPVEEKIAEVETFVLSKLRRELDRQVSLHVAQEIKFKMNVFDTKKQGVALLQAELESLTRSIDVSALYAAKQAEFNAVLSNQDYLGALNIFNNKGVASDLSRLFGGTQIPELVIRLANSGRQEELRRALRPYIPVF